ncbi:MAG: isocitrate/isopropylmalate dehydrogenase family protein [Acidobacteria bacterium]|nr:MAG: isocitrate/isopropylmalate dehydrogenase family protein [Acidobacteriota bacterium]REK00295.1 MAG: isocitrate/isopropylmalate dehydrogenase family protein [Acidobacteriota bacterium]
MKYAITLLPGDGIGPEVTESMVRVVDHATGGVIEWERVLAGSTAVQHGMTPLPQEALDSIRRNRIAIKGPLQTPVGGGWRSVNVSLRQELDLYACVRPVKSMPGQTRSRYEDVDLIVIRENTEGLYSGREHQVVDGVVEALKIVTESASRRINRFSFEYARNQGRKRLTIVHKASVTPLSDGLFLDCARHTARDYPFLQVDYLPLDNLAMELVQDPTRFDMLVMGNLDGDVVSDLCAGLVGGLGMVPGANIGDGHAVFEAVHGTAPDIAGQGLANPIALILSAELMLRHIGEAKAAQRVRGAVEALLREGTHVTRDLGGRAGTEELTEALLRLIDREEAA